MTTLQNVNFYDTDDTLYSHSGFLALGDKLEPIGVFLPGVVGFNADSKTADLDENDPAVSGVIAGYKALMGL